MSTDKLHRRSPVLWCLVCVVFVATSACVLFVPQYGAAKTKLTVWTKFTADRSSDVATVADFERAYPDIEVELVGPKNDRSLVVAIAAGAAPDVSLIIATFDVPRFAQQGLILPLDDFIASAGLDLSSYAPGVVDSWKYQGKIWAMSYDTDIYMMHWHKGVFAQAGLDPEHLPQDITEFDRLARKLTEIDSTGTIQRMGFVPWQADWIAWAAPWNIEWFDAERMLITADNDRVVEMFEWMASYPERYGPGPIQALLSKIQGFEDGGALINEQVAMHLGGPWIATRLRRNAPDQEWGHGFLPYPVNGLPKASTTNALMLVIPAGTRHSKEAFEFVRFYASPEQSLSGVRNGTRTGMPVIREPAQAFVKMYPEHRPIMEVLMGPNLRPHLPMLPNSRFFREQLVWAKDQVISLTGTPRDVLQQITQRVQLDLDEAISP
ncbi:MAG: extracellular solute-binding protein [Limnochordia bacterium]